MRFLYPIELEELPVDEGGGLLVRFPDWNDAVTECDDLADALANAQDCLEEMIAHHINRRLALPEPGPTHGRHLIGPGPDIGLKAALWLAMREQGVTSAELARRVGDLTEQQVERLLNPRLKARPEPIHKCLAALGKRVVVELEDAA